MKRPWRKVTWSDLQPGQVILAQRSVLAHSASFGFVVGTKVQWLGVSPIPLPPRCDGTRVEILAELGTNATRAEANRAVKLAEQAWRDLATATTQPAAS